MPSDAHAADLRRWKPIRQQLKPYLFLLPILTFAVGFVYYPFFKTFLYAFSQVNFKGEIVGFAGTDNFSYLFSRRDFKIALENTLRLMLINVPATVALTLGMALLVWKRRHLSAVNETMFSVPIAVSMASAGLVFKVLLNPTVGYFNYALGLNIGWYTDKNTAMYGILMLTVWMGLGFNFLLFLSALRSIPSGILEAATLDGAGPLARFFRVQLPLIVPTLFYVACTNMVQAMMTSGPVIILTQGTSSLRATTTLIYMMYSSGYSSANYGLAACVSLVTFFLTLTFTVLGFWLEGKRGSYQ